MQNRERRFVMVTEIKRLMILLVSIGALVTAGCGPKAAPSTSVMDTPEYHYTQGLKYLDKEQIDEAMKSFDRAVDLDPKSPLGYIGKGLAFGKKGDFKAAFENMEKAKGLETKGIEARIGMIRLHSLQRGKDFIKACESEFKNANEKEPNSARLHYFMGMAYKSALDFDKAAGMFRTVLDLNKDFTGEANAEWALIQKIQRAAPGTEIGKKIALIDKIDRADTAALFDQEMNLEKLFTKRGTRNYDTTFKAPTESSTRFAPETTVKMEPATDIQDHWLKPSIDTILKLQIRGLEAGPNHVFEPDKLITKAEFSLMLEDILIKVSGDEKLATKFLGATSRNFLETDKATGEFRPGDPVSGADALLAIREFKNQLKF